VVMISPQEIGSSNWKPCDGSSWAGGESLQQGIAFGARTMTDRVA